MGGRLRGRVQRRECGEQALVDGWHDGEEGDGFGTFCVRG